MTHEAEDDYLKGATIFFEDFRQAMAGVDLEQLPSHVAVARLAKGVAGLGAALNGVLQYLIEGDNDCRKTLKESKIDVGHMVKVEIGPDGAKAAPPTVLLDPAPTAATLLWIHEVAPKLRQLLQCAYGHGAMNEEELKVLSAGLDVAKRARDDRRR